MKIAPIPSKLLSKTDQMIDSLRRKGSAQDLKQDLKQDQNPDQNPDQKYFAQSGPAQTRRGCAPVIRHTCPHTHTHDDTHMHTHVHLHTRLTLIHPDSHLLGKRNANACLPPKKIFC